jgi:hypothetical protein
LRVTANERDARRPERHSDAAAHAGQRRSWNLSNSKLLGFLRCDLFIVIVVVIVVVVVVDKLVGTCSCGSLRHWQSKKETSDFQLQSALRVQTSNIKFKPCMQGAS